MEDKRNTMKEHLFIFIITITLLVGFIILTIYFFKTHKDEKQAIAGFIILYFWGLSVIPAGYYFFRAEFNPCFQKQPKFIFSERFQFDFYFILIAPILIPNYIWLFLEDIKNRKRRKDWTD